LTICRGIFNSTLWYKISKLKKVVSFSPRPQCFENFNTNRPHFCVNKLDYLSLINIYRLVWGQGLTLRVVSCSLSNIRKVCKWWLWKRLKIIDKKWWIMKIKFCNIGPDKRSLWYRRPGKLNKRHQWFNQFEISFKSSNEVGKKATIFFLKLNFEKNQYLPHFKSFDRRLVFISRCKNDQIKFEFRCSKQFQVLNF